MRRYPLHQLHEEVAYVAHHLHWSYQDLMGMEHADRLRWVAHAARLDGERTAPGDSGAAVSGR
jgi:hypothetical protein